MKIIPFREFAKEELAESLPTAPIGNWIGTKTDEVSYSEVGICLEI